MSSVPFAYIGLLVQVETIQNRIVEIENILHDRFEIDKNKFNVLKSRSLTFNDPYGNKINEKHLDHELIRNVIKKYKKDYVPKYLQDWIKIGVMKNDVISSLDDYELKSTVSIYENDCQLISYGCISIWYTIDNHSSYDRLPIPVLLMGKVEKIKMKIKEKQDFIDIELKLCMIDKNNWDEGKTLNPDDTIMSCRLYENNYIIVAKLLTAKVKLFILILILTMIILFLYQAQ